MPIESHLKRPILEELQHLHDIAVREHGPNARSVGLIKESIERERTRQARDAQPVRTRTPARDEPGARPEGRG
jgi:hypothetical protein